MKAFVIDVDGVLTDGRMWYTKEGKMMKAFGPDDHDALNMIRDKIRIAFVTADTSGYGISLKRIVDIGFGLCQVPMRERVIWIESTYGLSETIYMGDGMFEPATGRGGVNELWLPHRPDRRGVASCGAPPQRRRFRP